MAAIVNSVLENSIAEELEINTGDEIVTIDGSTMRDMIDYNFLCKGELITVEIKKTNGEIEEIELEKDYDDDLGIVFESAIFDKIKPCHNHCIFCFVDQQPKGLRDTLYIKDDDYRLSYLQGSYITLTNLTEADKKRIEAQHLGPFFVSVHTTNPELRVKMLRNPKAAEIMEHLKWLKSLEIPINAQIVLCPGYNDGKELDRTLKDLSKMNVLSVAIVPVGVTNFRNENLKTVTPEVAKETIEISSKYKNVCCSDEFFLLAEEEIPQAEYYGNFSQLEDGVGSLRLLLEDFKSQKLPNEISKPLKISFATSFAAKYAIDKISEELNKIENLTSTVNPVKSEYWGEKITVAGLITSCDLINAIQNDPSDVIIIPSVMLRPYSEDFLDGKTLTDVKNLTEKDFLVIKDCYSTKEIVDFISTY